MKNLVLFAVVPALAVVAWTPPAQAGGYDTPILYSARHMGMGGTAVSYVSDGSALFHNPAGLGYIERANLIGDFSLIIGDITGSPTGAPMNTPSETTLGPFFLVGGGVRLHDWVTVGLAVYPVASAGATYTYPTAGMQSEDSTTLFFLEASPGVALSVPESVGIGKLNIGVGYRITYVSLDRRQATGDLAPVLDFSMSGLNFAGLRFGLQYEPIPELQFGVSYRHKTVTEVSNDEGIALALPFTDISTEFTLPSRLTLGLRGNFHGIGAAFDFEYGFNSQNVRSDLTGSPAGGAPLTVANVFAWQDSFTLRGGVEYDIRLDPNQSEANLLTPRLGYIFDSTTSNKSYPTAFGTPPGPTHVLTLGVGFDGGPWEANLAYAYRFGSATVTAADIAAGVAGPEGACMFCSQPGDYSITMHGIYLDASYDFE
jgi:long-subunit fatty acid transport protein